MANLFSPLRINGVQLKNRVVVSPMQQYSSSDGFANSVIESGDADLAVIAREHLKNPYFSIHAGIELGIPVDVPWQYKRGFN